MSNILKRFSVSTKNSLFENCLLCAAIALTSSFLYFDGYRSYMKYFKVLSFLLIFLVWIYCAMVSGKNKKYGFLVFAGLYWVVPCVYLVLYPLRDNLHHYSKWLAELNRISDFLFNKPFLFVAEKMQYAPFYFVIVLIIVTFSFYFIGGNISSLYIENTNKGEYDEDDDEIDAEYE